LATVIIINFRQPPPHTQHEYVYVHAYKHAVCEDNRRVSGKYLFPTSHTLSCSCSFHSQSTFALATRFRTELVFITCFQNKLSRCCVAEIFHLHFARYQSVAERAVVFIALCERLVSASSVSFCIKCDFILIAESFIALTMLKLSENVTLDSVGCKHYIQIINCAINP
jgi:hypothetical protein